MVARAEGLPTKILGPITSPATAIGKLRSIVAEETGLPSGLRVVAPGTHGIRGGARLLLCFGQDGHELVLFVERHVVAVERPEL